MASRRQQREKRLASLAQRLFQRAFFQQMGPSWQEVGTSIECLHCDVVLGFGVVRHPNGQFEVRWLCSPHRITAGGPVRTDGTYDERWQRASPLQSIEVYLKLASHYLDGAKRMAHRGPEIAAN